jgi:hypothetical protein
LAKITTHVCAHCGQTKVFRADQQYCSKYCANHRGSTTNPPAPSLPKPQITQENLVDLELEKLREKREGKEGQLKILQSRVLRLEAENSAFLKLSEAQPDVVDVLPKTASGTSESALVFPWSDWHIEETVLPDQVSNKNEYNLEIMEARFQKLLRGGMAWYKISSRDTTIKTIVLALLGDFITGSIHDDLAEGNSLAPADAIHKAYSLIVSGIKFLLANTPKDVELVIPCHSGNHGRMTKEQRIATEAGNSLEYFMYLMLRDYFQDEKRITFIVQPGYHSYVRFFEGAYEIRFHHGHQINYQGGVGGITIPVNKAIAQWNKARTVNLDVFGHFHTKFDGGNFVTNGSMIGYNAYAVSIKASYEKPEQQLFLVNREYGEKTAVMPIFLT